HIASNDIAVRGVRPRWLLSVLYLPENATEELIDRITSQIDMAAREVGAMVVGGHTEYTPGIARPLISMTAIGVAQRGRYVTTGGARVGDAVVMTKSAAIEGTAILSTDFKNVLLKLGVSEEIIKRGERFIEKVSVVKEALALAEAGLATSMHDPTEGGLLGGLVEIAYASNKTIYIWEENILLAEETAAITGTLGLDPLKLISSGTLIATIPQDRVEEALKTLHSIGVEATAIGYVGEKTDSLATIYRKNGSIEKIKEVYVEDELAKAWRLWREGRS
ncbi:MAG: AIR synthase-related protein, partial [Ignisphaera sp.]